MAGKMRELAKLAALLFLGGWTLAGCAHWPSAAQSAHLAGKPVVRAQDLAEAPPSEKDETIPLAAHSEPTSAPMSEGTGPEIVRYHTLQDAALGFAGRSRNAARDIQEGNHFVPTPDRWRIGLPEWDRYGKGHPPVDDYPYAQGSRWDPFRQNVLKGDYPIIGQDIFLDITGTTQALFELRQTPTGTTPFESTANAGQKDFFGKIGRASCRERV